MTPDRPSHDRIDGAVASVLTDQPQGPAVVRRLAIARLGRELSADAISNALRRLRLVGRARWIPPRAQPRGPGRLAKVTNHEASGWVMGAAQMPRDLVARPCAHDVVLSALQTAIRSIYIETAEKPTALEIAVPRVLWHAIAATSRMRITMVPGCEAYTLDIESVPITVVPGGDGQ
jgi:hypothetical protein